MHVTAASLRVTGRTATRLRSNCAWLSIGPTSYPAHLSLTLVKNNNHMPVLQSFSADSSSYYLWTTSFNVQRFNLYVNLSSLFSSKAETSELWKLTRIDAHCASSEQFSLSTDSMVTGMAMFLLTSLCGSYNFSNIANHPGRVASTLQAQKIWERIR